MSDPTIVVGVQHGDDVERVPVSAVRTERDRDGTLRCYDSEDREIATFPESLYAVKAEHLED